MRRAELMVEVSDQIACASSVNAVATREAGGADRAGIRAAAPAVNNDVFVLIIDGTPGQVRVCHGW
jgi:hypothetical protein